jgi:hypothetical protein
VNPFMLQALADSRTREIRRVGAQRRDRIPAAAPTRAQATVRARAQATVRARAQATVQAPAMATVQAPALATAGHRWPRMRARVGYALVEAGLHLLSTASPAQRG